MKTITRLLVTLAIVAITSLGLSAKNYSRKAMRPTASDHTWAGYDYNFNIDENGLLTGTNTFSKVYNTVPTKWHNTGYYGEGIRMLTGSETLTITVLPGNSNYKYTFNTAITEWQWDTHLLKWVKRRDIPSNGIRTFTVKDGVLNGAFEVPIAASLFGADFLLGTSKNGVIPNGGNISWKRYLYEEASPAIIPQIKSEGDSIRMNVENYISDVLKGAFSGNFGCSENGTYVELRFPIVGDEHEMLAMIGAMTGTTSTLEMYDKITLPDVYYDAYVDPYAPVTTILPNGHKLVTTQKTDGSVDKLETWEENGYFYSKIGYDSEKFTMGTKTIDGKKFIHVTDKGYNSYEEKGFYDNDKYYLTYINHYPDHYEIDWTPYASDGYFIITSDGVKKYAVPEEDAARHTFSDLSMTSIYTSNRYKYYVFKEVSPSGFTTVAASNQAELSPAAQEYLKFANHPYIIQSYDIDNNYGKYAFIPTEHNRGPSNYKKIRTVTMDSIGNIVLFDPPSKNGPDRDKYHNQTCSYLWQKSLLELSQSSDNPLTKIAALIAMELDLPNYDVEKVDAKIVGKRTANLLKKLPSVIKDRPLSRVKKVKVDRIVKNGNTVTVWVKETNKDGNESVRKMKLEDNIPSHKSDFDIWTETANELK